VERELYFISVASEMLGMHPQTLRKYERLGLIRPSRTMGNMAALTLVKSSGSVDQAPGREAGISLAACSDCCWSGVMQRIRPLMDEARWRQVPDVGSCSTRSAG
jgi:MerR family transcriptional regulator/heat shock protein HspR